MAKKSRNIEKFSRKAIENIEDNTKKSNYIYFLKDLVEIIKAETIFFSPMYISFVGFMVAKPEFIKSADPFLKFLFFVTFCFGILCALSISNILSNLEALRLIFNLDINTGDGFIKTLSDSEREEIFSSLRNVGTAVKYQRRIFRWSMYLIYFTTCSSLVKMFFSGYFDQLVAFTYRLIVN